MFFLWRQKGYGEALRFCGLGVTARYLRPELRQDLLNLYGDGFVNQRTCVSFTFLCFYSTYQNLLGFIFCLNKQYISLIASTAPAVWTGNISVRKWTICLFQAGQHWLVCWWHVWVANWRRSARPDLHLSAGSTVPWNPTRWSILLRF